MLATPHHSVLWGLARGGRGEDSSCSRALGGHGEDSSCLVTAFGNAVRFGGMAVPLLAGWAGRGAGFLS